MEKYYEVLDRYKICPNCGSNNLYYGAYSPNSNLQIDCNDCDWQIEFDDIDHLTRRKE